MTLWAHQHCLWSGGSCFQFNFKAVFSLYLIIFPKTPPTSSNNNNELCFMNYKALSHTWQLLILTKTHSPRQTVPERASGSGVWVHQFTVSSCWLDVPLSCSSSVIQPEEGTPSCQSGLWWKLPCPCHDLSCPRITFPMTYLCTGREEKMKSCF